GLVLTPPFSEMPEIVRALSLLDVHIIRIVSGKESPDDLSPCVMVNDRDAATNVTQHLIDLGHQRIGFINGGMEHMSSHERLDGYREALDNNDITIDDKLVISGEYSFESGVQGANQLLNGKQRPSAIFACNDEIAAGALFAARLMNISVPEQLSIIGFEDSPFSRQTWPKLTTAHQPNETIAQHAASLLIAATRQQTATGVTNQFVPHLVVRDSTARFGEDS
ncbi:MAG: LacI family transcriptional regulator, partial [Phenylobacterium sp.]